MTFGVNFDEEIYATVPSINKNAGNHLDYIGIWPQNA